MPLFCAVIPTCRLSSASRRRSRAASGSVVRTAASTALMIRCLDQPCQLPMRAASDWSTFAISFSSEIKSVRLMINRTVRQSVRPSASSAATRGNRVSNAAASVTTKPAAIGDRFIAADTSAVVCSNPPISPNPCERDCPKAVSRCRSNAATAAIRRAIRADSCRYVDSISATRAAGSSSRMLSNIFAIMPRPADNFRCLRDPTSYGVTRILQCRSGSARSSNAAPTASRPTSPVIIGVASISPSANARSVAANSSGL